jgi:hypothetical protein
LCTCAELCTYASPHISPGGRSDFTQWA